MTKGTAGMKRPNGALPLKGRAEVELFLAKAQGGLDIWSFVEISGPWDAKNTIRALLGQRKEKTDA